MTLIELIKKAKLHDREAMIKIIEKFEPKIRKEISKSPTHLKEDLRQEIAKNIIEAVYKYDMKNIPNLFEYINYIKERD
ncbi:helix-turn-helix domain-containing protein [Brevibacillus laterosporus]|uniref:helix-turn-helix domain-containing protein n=1 Tax=Brevibacillus laterosporus TaxID=1465 RepID=UPI000839D7D8|nr:helix-turn-helix domain-containing protein [Brevibacillus laterosporus]